MVNLSSEQIKEKLVEWAYEQDFTAPYGILDGDHVDRKGKKYKSVTFGYARTLDATVMIYNRNFMIYRSSRGDDNVFKSFDELLKFLKAEFN